jgi:hypothetical protein
MKTANFQSLAGFGICAKAQVDFIAQTIHMFPDVRSALPIK